MINLAALNKTLMIKPEDRKQLDSIRISIDDFELQLERFKNGIAPLKLIQPAVLGDGISSYDEQKKNELIQLYQRFKESLDLVKFVPASGAATRMFKSLFQGLQELEAGEPLNQDAQDFVDNIHQYPFLSTLKERLEAQGDSLDEIIASKRYEALLEAVLDKSGLDYGSLPKALIEFHADASGSRTALEEHIRELLAYANSEGKGRLHLTVSAEHLAAVEELCKELGEKYSQEVEVEFEFSLQDSSTNTVAVDMNNDPVRTQNGELLFRPGGHGALLKNLNEINAQLIFIKNIDNVSASKWMETNVSYKELLAGRLLEMRENIHSLLNGLIHESGRKEASRIIFERWGITVESEEEIKAILDRPLRVCGMVKNTGAPGGGPFWVQESDGSRSTQIVESSQVDMKDQGQLDIWNSASHFNPVDIVCWVEDHSGVQFDLMKYRDENTGFITSKSFQGQEIKAQELPGLWNGAMANWITEFVEVPIETFNPVKTVLDLLNKGHQG